MRWERVKYKTKTPVSPEGRKSLGRKGGTAGPGKRWGHTCNSVKNGRALYVFGGYGKDNRQTNDVHIFHTAKQTWSKPMVKGTPPSSRDSHSCTTVGVSLYVFGGTDEKGPLQDVYILDTVTNTWTKPQVDGDGPAPREGHSAALIGHKLFVFGGCGKTLDDSEEIYFDDLYILDTVKLHWTKAVTKGTPPSPRDSHTCSAWDNKLIVLGGEDALDSYLADVHVLDTDAMEWREFQTSGQLLTPRAGHATVSVGKHIFVFGGFADDQKLFDDLHVLNIETGVWSKVTTTDLGPCARFSVAGDCIDARSGGVLVFIGGCNENLEALDDMYYLDTELQLEKSQDERPERFSLRKELKRKRQGKQLVVKSPEIEKEASPLPTIDMQPILSLNTALPAPIPAFPGVGPASDKSSLYEFKPAEKRIFEAKITDVFHYGYTIESNIDGKLLRGLLFSYKPGFTHAVHAYLTRKMISSGKAKGDRKTKLKIARATKRTKKRTDGGQGAPLDSVSGGESLVTPPDQLVNFSNQDQQHTQLQTQTQSQSEPHGYQPPHQHQPQEPHQHQPQLLHQQQHLPQKLQQHASTAPQQEQDLLAPFPPHHQQLREPLPTPTASVLQQDSRHFMGSGYGGIPLPVSEAFLHQASGQGAGVSAICSVTSSAQGSQPSREQTLQTDHQQ